MQTKFWTIIYFYSYQKIIFTKHIKKQISNIPFKLGIDENGNYGYIKDGADSVTPFKKGCIKSITSLGWFTGNTDINVTKDKTYIITTYNNPTISGLSVIYNGTTETYVNTVSRLIIGVATDNIIRLSVSTHIHEIEFE